MEEFVTDDPFQDLLRHIETSTHAARLRALNAFHRVRECNKYFEKVLASRLILRNTFDIVAPAILVHTDDTTFVSRL